MCQLWFKSMYARWNQSLFMGGRFITTTVAAFAVSLLFFKGIQFAVGREKERKREQPRLGGHLLLSHIIPHFGDYLVGGERTNAATWSLPLYVHG